MYQNAGEKGIVHLDPDDPPRRRANKQRGHGTFENDRPAIFGAVGRESGVVEMQVVKTTDRATLQPLVEQVTAPGATVNTDEWSSYGRLKDTGRGHHTVNHSVKEWARDDDGDGIREVHTHTIEGTWTGLRNVLRPFRGVSKWYLAGYVAMFVCAHDFRQICPAMVRLMTALAA